MRSPTDPHAGTRGGPDATPAASGDRAPTLRDYHAVNRGGGLYTETISQWVAAVLAAAAYRRGLPPTALTVANFVIGLVTAVTVTATAPAVADGRLPAWPVGLVALVGWQLAYAFDCADGQLARATGQTSHAGARVDVLCDLVMQIGLVTAVSAVAVAHRPSTPAWLVAAFAGSWMVSLVTSVLQQGPAAASLVPSRSLPVRIIKLIRDAGALFLVAGLVVLAAPAAAVWFMGVFAVVNGGFLLASVAFAARAALRGRAG